MSKFKKPSEPSPDSNVKSENGKSNSKSNLGGPLSNLLKHFKISKWDLILLGDGSGFSWKKHPSAVHFVGIGFASVGIVPWSPQRQLFTGAFNRGTNNMAEIYAYINGLEWFCQPHIRKRWKQNKTSFGNVHIISDSEYCVNTGNKIDTERSTRGVHANIGLWSGIQQLSYRHNLRINWHWCSREDVPLQILTDGLSKSMRIAVEEATWAFEDKYDIGAYNPT